MLRTPTLLTLLTAVSMLSACGRDAVEVPDDVDEAAEPEAAVEPEATVEPEAAEPDAPPFMQACGNAAPAVEFEILDAPAADGLAEVRLRWSADAPLPNWECCPYQHVLQAWAQGGQIVAQHEGTDGGDRIIDLQIAVDGAAGEQLTVGLGVCAAHTDASWIVAPSPFVETTAALAACEPVGDQIEFDAQGDADLRVTAFEIEGAIAPGATIQLNVALAEVAGVGHGYYPGFIFEFDPPVVELNEAAGVFYATFACEEMGMTVPVQLPADLEPGTTLTITTHVGEPLCRDGDCHINDTVSLTRRVVAAP